MVRIVDGVIVSESESSSHGGTLSTGPGPLLSSYTVVYGYSVPTWTLSLPILAGFVLGGVPGAMMTTTVIGVGYCLGNTSGSSSTIQVRDNEVFFLMFPLATTRDSSRSKEGQYSRDL
jgi:hypothetical protein